MIRKIVLTLDGRDPAAARTVHDLAGALGRACDAELVVLAAGPAVSPREAYDPGAPVPHAGDSGRPVVLLGDGERIRTAVSAEEPDLVLTHHDGPVARWLLRRGPGRGLGAGTLMTVRVGAPPPRTRQEAGPAQAPGPRGLARLRALVAGFYRDRLAWVALVVTSLLMAYVGGAAMFWVHAVYLGEPGPEIRPVLHYALDATAGFVGLTPPLFAILPFAVWAGRHRGSVRPWRYALAGGSVFALVTAGGPFAHDTLVARGTWIARHVTALVGTSGAPVGPATDVPLPESIAAQLVAGIPVYVLLMWVSLHALRAAVRVRRTRTARPAEQPA